MKYKVVNKETGMVYNTFEELAEANWCRTEVFGPDWDTVEIIEENDDNE